MAEEISKDSAKNAPSDSKSAGAVKPATAATPEQMVEAALNETSAAAAAVSRQAGIEAGPDGQPLELPEFKPAASSVAEQLALGLLDDVTLRVKVELGRTRMYVEDVLRLNANSVVELDKAAGDPVDIYVNDRHVARGEVLVLNENFCVRVSEVIQKAVEETN